MKKARKKTVWNETRFKELTQKMESYIKKTDIPILKEFCFQNNIFVEDLYKHKELKAITQKLIYKKEMALEQLGYTKNSNYPFIIFSLKQLGWTDTLRNEVVIEEKKIAESIEKRLGLK